MTLFFYMSLELGEPKPITIYLQLADKSIKRPNGIIEEILIKVHNKCSKIRFPSRFHFLDIEEDSNIFLILGRPFLATGKGLIDVYDGKMILKVDNEHVIQYVQGVETSIDFGYFLSN